ncbi:zinc finger protein 501 isoform X2 [Drosophila sulfurigaster albostrigata]|uniref:Zinc finger protein 501 isoform X2 n=1 Tax=Drosophila albomicans TaxID=7291 RepID=A0A6P8Y1W6_DROAB|nr:zinc finger protein 501 isoform X2 [Drosophila albomicans]XP_062121910.1 zinc finger protein 501 isoform X2 [Drosophila sulfurigaster albostrigata]
MHLNHATAATAAMANYQHYAPAQLATHGVGGGGGGGAGGGSGGGGAGGSGLNPNSLQQPTTIASLQQSPFALHQLTAVQAIQHPTHQAMLHPQHPLVHLLDISTTTTNSGGNHTPISPMKQEVQSVVSEDESVVDDPRKKKQCHVCKNKFRQLTTLRNHMKIHTDERPYKCKHCDKAFRQISTLTNHVKIHTGEKPFTCNICAKDFRQQSTLINHIKTHKADHSAMPAPLVPGTQQLTSGLLPNNLHSTTPNILQLDHHPLLHFLDGNTTVSSVVASNVAAAAAANNTKIEHYQTAHSGRMSVGNINMLKGENPDRPFGCSVCSRFFSQQSTLVNHIKTHTGEKPYKCKICEVNFRQVATLNNHMKIHTGEKPYNCSYCPKQFRQKSTLQNHLRVHTC